MLESDIVYGAEKGRACLCEAIGIQKSQQQLPYKQLQKHCRYKKQNVLGTGNGL